MLTLLFAAAALSATTPLAAADPRMPPIAHVSYADLDFTKAEGKTVLDRRIARALRVVCAEALQVGLSKRMEEIKCRRAAIAHIGPQRTRAMAQAAGQGTKVVELTAQSASGAN